MNDDKGNVQDQENIEVKDTKKVGTQANENKDEENSNDSNADVKTFSQEEVNAMLKKEREKVSKKIPDAKQYKAFQEWQESQKTDEQKNLEKETEYQKTKNDLIEAQHQIAILESGVDKEQADFVLFKVSKMDGDFDENLESYLKEHPQYLKSSSSAVPEGKQTTGTSVQKGASSSSSGVDDILRKRHPDLFK